MDLYKASNGFSEDGDEGETLLTLEEYEESKKALTRIVETGNTVARLLELPEFKAVILQGYFCDEPKRLGELMSSGRLHGETFNKCADELKAIGKLKSFIAHLVQQSEQAVNELASLEVARDEAIRMEELSRA